MSLARTPPSTQAPSASATLMLEGAGRLEQRQIVDGSTIGRDSRSDVAIDHPTVSRAHARIEHRRDGWWLVDLGSQNGSTINDARVEREAPLTDGCTLGIGRVRTWFFAGTGPPAEWQPADQPQLAGKLMRCRCGHIGWAPSYAAGMTLTCGTCGRDVVMNNSPAVPLTEAALASCAGCHTDIAMSDRAHACPACGATMHHDCWIENRGCAVYGCSQVSALDDESPDDVHRAAEHEPAGGLADSEAAPAALHEVARVGLLTIVGLPMFGAPALAFATFRMLRGQGSFVAAAFVGGCAGILASAWWWLNVWE